MSSQRLPILFAALTWTCAVAPAQTVTGTISGTVLDQSDAVVPKVNVTLESELTGGSRTVATGDTGEFVFTAVPPGTYKLTFEAAEIS
jgi:hypothetical protein